MLCLQLGKSIVTKNNSNLIARLVHITSINMAKKALLILAEGAEEMEAVISIDVMRRGGVCFGHSYQFVFINLFIYF